MENGWIKLYRSIDQWEWRSDPNTFSVWMYCLTHARHEAGSWQGVSLEAGQLVTGRNAISKETGVSIRGVRTALDHLTKSGNLTIKPTNKFSVVTITNWDFWQCGWNATDQQTDQQPTNNRPTTDQQPTTNKNVKNEIMKESAVLAEPETAKDESGESNFLSMLKYFGFPTADKDTDEAKKLVVQYGSDWVREAMSRATDNGNTRNWRYVRKILENWSDNGCIDSARKAPKQPESPKQKFRWVGDGDDDEKPPMFEVFVDEQGCERVRLRS